MTTQQANGKEILRIARVWSMMVDAAGDNMPRIVALRERMYSPQPEDMVVDVALLDSDTEYYAAGVGVLVARHPDGSLVIRPCDEMSTERRIEHADVVAVPGLGRGWPNQ